MEYLGELFGYVIEFSQNEFNVFGYTISFWSIFILLCGVELLCILIGGFFNGGK